jgi:hypothetical protein
LGLATFVILCEASRIMLTFKNGTCIAEIS